MPTDQISKVLNDESVEALSETSVTQLKIKNSNRGNSINSMSSSDAEVTFYSPKPRSPSKVFKESKQGLTS